MEELHEQQIIAAVLSGEVDAYRILVKRHQKPIFNLLYRTTGSYEDALDLAQETFTKAYEKLETFRIGSPFFPWLYTIALNHGRNFLRRNRIKKIRLFVRWERRNSGRDCHGQESVRIWESSDAVYLRKSLLKLSLEYREAVMLHFHEGLSMKEIAAALQLSVSGAKMRVHRGLQKLRQLLVGQQEKERRGSNEEKSHAANG